MTEVQQQGNEVPEKVPVSKKKMWVVISSIIAAAAVLYMLWYLKNVNTVYTDDALIDANKVTISSKYAGRIGSLLVGEGQSVKKGDILLKLDNSDLMAQREQAKASLFLAEESSQLANVNFARAEEDFNRVKAQFEGKIVPKEQFDHAQKALESAKVQNSIALAQIKTARAQLGVIEIQLTNGEVKAPMDGVVAKKWVLAGDVVSAGQAIYTVYDLSNVWITANFEETKYGLIALDERAIITIDAFGGKKITGKVTQLGSNTASQFSLMPSSNASGNFTKVTQRIPIKVTPDEEAKEQYRGKLLPGMSVELTIVTR